MPYGFAIKDICGILYCFINNAVHGAKLDGFAIGKLLAFAKQRKAMGCSLKQK